MRRLLKKTLLVFLFISIFLFNFPVTAQIGEVTDIGIARYYVESVKEENELPNGVKHYTHIGHTSAKSGEVTDMGMGVSEPFVADKYYPQQVNILEVPSSTEVSLIPWAYIKNSAWSLKTVREIARDFEAVNPGYKVIAGVNGDFFDITAANLYPFTPNNLHSSFGDNFKSVHNNRAVGFLNDGSDSPLIGNKPIERNEFPTLAVYDNNDNIIKEFKVNKVNEEPGSDEVSVIYPRYHIPVHGASPRSEIINVENAFIVDDGEYSIPFTKVNNVYGYESDNLDFFGKGRITSFGSGELGANDFAIKTNNSAVIAALEIGAKIRVQYEFTGAFENVDNIIGVNQRVLIDGVKKDNITQRAPRTMVGVKEDGTILLSVIDGRQPNKQLYGAAMAEMAAVMKHYGAVDAYNLDGGGSSTMIILDDENNDFRVTNTYSDSVERTDANALLVVIKTPVLDITPSEITNESINFNVDVIQDNGYETSELYMKLNGETKRIENSTVSFSNLQKQAEYRYEILYKKDDEYQSIYKFGTVKTGKIRLRIDGVDIRFSGKDLVVSVDYTDPDNTLISGSISIGGRVFDFRNGIASIRNFKGNSLEDYEISLTTNTDNGLGDVTKVYTNYMVYTSSEVAFDYSLEKFGGLLKGIYK